MMPCPFYAHSLLFDSLAIRPTTLAPLPRSNRCALITSAHSPCRMEMEGLWPHWRECSRNPEVSEREASGSGQRAGHGETPNSENET